MSKSDPVPSLSSRILRLAKSIEEMRNTFLLENGLQPGHDALLLTLGESDGITMGSLAEKTGNSASATTKIAVKLEAEELMRRESSRLDSRQNHAYLTEKGGVLVDQITAAYRAIDNELTEKARPKDVERGFKLFDRLEADSSTAAKTPRKAGSKKQKSAGKKSKPSGKKKSKKQ